MNGIKDMPHREFPTLVAAERFSAWVDGKLGYPSGAGTRSHTIEHARIMAHDNGVTWAYPLTTTVLRLLDLYSADPDASLGTTRNRLPPSWARPDPGV